MNREHGKRKDLDQLLSGVTPDNVHGEIDFGGPVGREQGDPDQGRDATSTDDLSSPRSRNKPPE